MRIRRLFISIGNMSHLTVTIKSGAACVKGQIVNRSSAVQFKRSGRPRRSRCAVDRYFPVVAGVRGREVCRVESCSPGAVLMIIAAKIADAVAAVIGGANSTFADRGLSVASRNVQYVGRLA
jgi:hypothetical protein